MFKRRDENYEYWSKQLRYCRQSRERFDLTWRRWYNIIDDNLWASNKLVGDTQEPIQVNELASIVEVLIPNIVLNPGVIEIRAIKGEDRLLAAIHEYIAKYLLVRYNLIEEFIYNVYDTLVLGSSIAKVGHWFSPLVGEAQWRQGLAGELGVRQYSVYGLQVPLFEFYPDYQAGKWSRMRYFIFEISKHIDELKEHPMMDQKVVKDLKPGISEAEVYSMDIDKDDKRDYVVLQEVHDLINGKLMVMCANNAEKFLYNDAEPYPMIPIEHLSFYPRPLNVFGKGISQSVEQHLISLSKLHTYLDATVRHEAVKKLVYNAAQWKPDAVKKLETPEDEAIGIIGDPNNSYEVIDLGSPRSSYVFEGAINTKLQTLRSVAGITLQMLGRHETGVQTAHESSMLQNASDARLAFRVAKFNLFVERVIEKMLYIVTTTYGIDRIGKMVGYPTEAIGAILRPYDPSKFMIKYGQSAVNSQSDEFSKFQLWMSMFAPVVNPVAAARRAADILGLEYTDEMIINGLLLGGSGVPGQGTAQNSSVSSGGAPPEVTTEEQFFNMLKQGGG